MVLFVIFILSAVLLGVGTMLAPALPTQQPRIGLASALTLIFVLTGSILWTQLVQWDTLVIDYLLFGVVSLVVLGGTMMQAHDSREGDAELDPVLWLSRANFLFLTVLGIICIALIWTPIFPTDLAPITVDASQAITELAHFGDKAYTTLAAYLTQQLRQDSLIVQQAIISVILFLCVFTAYDLGTEIKNTHLGRILSVSVLVILAGTLATIADFPLLLPMVLLGLSGSLFAVRLVKHRQIFDGIAVIILLVIVILL